MPGLKKSGTVNRCPKSVHALWAKEYTGLTCGLPPTYKLYLRDLTEEEFSELQQCFLKMKDSNNKNVSMARSKLFASTLLNIYLGYQVHLEIPKTV